jgi:predicted Zn-ribbon and HTH transcriptional regulator
MENNGWFKCEKCGYEEKKLVPDHVKVSETPCPKCGGKMIKT